MGDRGNIFFVDRLEDDELEGVYMYTHWSGSMLPLLVRDALERGRGRWGDPQYLARVVFCELVKDSILEETGYGLSSRLGDNEHIVIRIDDRSSRVSFHEPGKERLPGDSGLVSWSYEEFLATHSAEAERAFLGVPAIEPGKPLPDAIPSARARRKAPTAGGKTRAKAKPAASGAATAGGKANPAARSNGTATRASSNGSGHRNGNGNGNSHRNNGNGNSNGHSSNGNGGAATRPRTPRRRAGAK